MSSASPSTGSIGLTQDLRRSCIFCRQRKMKCSGEQPWCKTCRDRSQACVYEPSAGKSPSSKRKYNSAFSIRPHQHASPSALPDSISQSSKSVSSILSSAYSISDGITAGNLGSPMTFSPFGSTLHVAPAGTGDMSAVSMHLVPKLQSIEEASGSDTGSRKLRKRKSKADTDASVMQKSERTGGLSSIRTSETVGEHLTDLFQTLWPPTSTSASLPAVQQSRLQSPQPPNLCQDLEVWMGYLSTELLRALCAAISPLRDFADVSNADLGDCKAVLLADLTTAPLTNIGNEYSTNDGDLDAIRGEQWCGPLISDAFESHPLLSLVMSKSAFLNRFENGAEEKVLLLTILAEEIMHAPTASASLARGAQLQSGAKLHDRAYRILANQRMDTDSVIVNSQSLVLQAFRKLLRGEIKLAICMFILCQSATLWLLQDRQEHPQPPLLINGVDLTALDNELLTNTYWLSRAASQLLLLRIGLPLTSTLLAAGPSDIALIPSLPPCRPNATLLYHLEQTSGNYRMLPAHSRAIASLKLTSHISEVVCLLNAKFQTLATMPNAGPDIAPLREATHMEAITSEFPNTILDILCSLDSEVTDEHPEVLHMLRDIMVHLAFPRADVIASRSGFGPTSTGIHALNHLLMVIISAVASLSSTEQTPPLKSTISENAGDMQRILLDLEFRSDHLGRSALLAARLFDSAIRALEIVLFHCQLLPMPLADERQVSMFRLTSEATIFVLQRQGQILHLLQQMYSVLQQDRMICGPRRSTERRVKQLVQVLEDRGIIAVPAHRAAQGAGSETSSRPQTSQTRSSENDSQGSSQNSSQSSIFSEVGHQLQIVDEPVAHFGVPSQARTLSQWPATLIPAQNSASLGPARWQHRSWSELPHTPSNGGFLAGPSAASQVLPTQSVSMSLPTTPWASTGPTWSNWSLPPGFPTCLQQPSPITLAPAQSPTVDAVPDFSLAAGKSASGI